MDTDTIIANALNSALNSKETIPAGAIKRLQIALEEAKIQRSLSLDAELSIENETHFKLNTHNRDIKAAGTSEESLTE